MDSCLPVQIAYALARESIRISWRLASPDCLRLREDLSLASRRGCIHDVRELSARRLRAGRVAGSDTGALGVRPLSLAAAAWGLLLSPVRPGPSRTVG